MLEALIMIIGYLSQLVFVVVIVQFVLSLLIMFNVLSIQTPFVAALYTALNAILEPVLRPIRRILPDTGMIDLSPIVLIIGLQVIQFVLIGVYNSSLS
jgi:YggT family protein